MASSAVVGLLRVLLTANTAEFQTGMKAASAAADKWKRDFMEVGRQASAIGGALTKSVTLPLLAVGVALAKVGQQFDDASDQIRVATGATGQALKGLTDSFKNVLSVVPSSMQEVATAIGDLHTRTGATGKQLEGLSQQLLNMSRLGKTGISELVAGATRLFGDWSIATEKQSAALDFLWKTSQNTGIGLQRLQDLVVQFGAPMRAFGFSFEETAALMGRFEKEGVNLETVMSGLRFALGEFAKAGKEPATALKETIEAIKNAKTETDATAIAFQAFGKRAAVDMSRAILEGRFSIDQLVASLNASRETVNKAAEDTIGLSERFALLRNKAMLAAEPLGTAVLSALDKLLIAALPLMKVLEQMAHAFAAMPGPIQTVILGLGGIAAVTGPLVWTFGQLHLIVGTLIGAFGRKGIATKALTVLLGENTLATKANTAAQVENAAAAVAGASHFAMLARGLGTASLAVGTFIAAWQAGKWLDQFRIGGLSPSEWVEFLEAWKYGMAGVSAENLKLAITSRRAAAEFAQAAADWQEARQKFGITGARTSDIELPRMSVTTGAGAIDATYAQRLADVRRAVAALTVEQRQQIDAAEELGEKTEDVAKKLSISEEIIKAYLATAKDAAKATREATRDQEAWNDALDDASGRKAVKEMQELWKVYEHLQREGLPATIAFQEQLVAAIVAGVPAADALGLHVTDAFRAIAVAAPQARDAVNDYMDTMREAAGRGLGPLPLASFPLPGGGIWTMPGSPMGTSPGSLAGPSWWSRNWPSFYQGIYGAGALATNNPQGWSYFSQAGAAWLANRGGSTLPSRGIPGWSVGSTGGSQNFKMGAAGGIAALGGAPGAYEAGYRYGGAKGVLSGAGIGAQQGLQYGGPIGAAIGAGVGAISAWIGASGGEEKRLVNPARDEFLAQFGESGTGIGSGFANLADQLHKIGPAGDALFKRVINAQKMKEFETAVKDVTKAMQQMEEAASIEADLASLREQSKVSWQQMQDIAEKYGVTINDLGDNFKQLKTTANAEELLNAFATLKEGGTDTNVILTGMRDEFSAFVQEAIRFGTAIPENMRPLIESLAASGSLLDENGNKIDDISGLKWGDPVKTQAEIMKDAIQLLVDKLEELRKTLAGELPKAADEGIDETDRIIRAYRPPKIVVDVEYNDQGYDGGAGSAGIAASGGRVTRWGIQRFAGGGEAGRVWFPGRPSGTDTVPAWLTPGEWILNDAQQRALVGALMTGASAMASLSGLARAATADVSGGDTTIVVVDGRGSREDVVDRVLSVLPRKTRRNDAGFRTQMREALGVVS